MIQDKKKEIIANKIKALCTAYGSLKYEKIEHSEKDTLKTFSLLELKIIANETRNVIFINDNYARKFNADITDTRAVSYFLTIHGVYKPKTNWIKLYNTDDTVMRLKDIHKNNIEYYFEHTVIRYAIKNNLPIPRVELQDINDVKLFSYPKGILKRAFNDDELSYMKNDYMKYFTSK